MKVMSPEADRMKIMRKPDALFLSDMTVACLNFVRQAIASVSYTHLDVYKRQGYGCMRWPLKPAPDGNGEVIDQDAVNGLIDYAIAHGVKSE